MDSGSSLRLLRGIIPPVSELSRSPVPDRGILLVGSSRDPTFVHSVQALHFQKRDAVVVDIDRFCARGIIEGDLSRPETIVIRDKERSIRLAEFRSCYARFIELPLNWDATSPAISSRFRALQLAIESMTALVVNRPFSGGSNNSKPYQVQLLRGFGFLVPKGISTNSVVAAKSFLSSCDRGAIYKSNSGTRSIVHAVEEADLRRLASVTACPVFFQERLWGDDIRVHVVGNRCHAVRIRSDAVDYRYDQSGSVAEQRCALPPEIMRKCVDATAALGLSFSGIDFVQLQSSGEYVCLEINPMPGYHGYDLTLDYEISRSLGELLG